MVEPLRILEDGGLEGVIDHPGYEITKRIGNGSWGSVYAARDVAYGGEVAIKVLDLSKNAQRKMAERAITPFAAMKTEGEMAPGRHIVPRTGMVDANGVPFVVMPRYDEFLDRRLNEYGSRRHVGNGLEVSEATRYMGDIANGLLEMHEIRGRAHADVKPDNIAIDSNGRLLLNDLGNSTMTSLAWDHSGRRDNVGAYYTRAPELFSEGSHPERSSDVWSLGAVAYRFFTGSYPLEAELKNAKDPAKYLADIGNERLNEILQEKVKQNIPREHGRLRNLIGSCLEVSPQRRPQSYDLPDKISHAVDRRALLKDAWRFTKQFGVAVGAAATLGGILYLAKITPSPPKAEPPKVSGMLYLEEFGPKGRHTVFDIEEPRDLPEVYDAPIASGTTEIAMRATNDRSVAFLVDMQAKATLLMGGARDPLTDYQRKLYKDHAKETGKKPSTNFYNIQAHALEVMLKKIRETNGWGLSPGETYDSRIARSPVIRTHKGHIDLEDLMTMSRHSPTKVALAQQAANSPFFRDYIETKVFSPEDRRFMKHWLAHVHRRIGRK